MRNIDTDGFEAVPRELAVKAEQSPKVTPKALLTKSLQRLYQHGFARCLRQNIISSGPDGAERPILSSHSF